MHTKTTTEGIVLYTLESLVIAAIIVIMLIAVISKMCKAKDAYSEVWGFKMNFRINFIFIKIACIKTNINILWTMWTQFSIKRALFHWFVGFGATNGILSLYSLGL